MKSFGLARIGRDAEIRHTPSGDAVCNLSLAFSYGQKGSDGNRPTQWVDASFWGKRAEALAQYLTKGSLIAVTLDDVHIETYEGKNGPGQKLVGRVIDIELAGGKQAQSGTPNAPPAARTGAGYQAPAGGMPNRPAPAPANFSDMDDDIPF